MVLVDQFAGVGDEIDGHLKRLAEESKGFGVDLQDVEELVVGLIGGFSSSNEGGHLVDESIAVLLGVFVEYIGMVCFDLVEVCEDG